MFSSSNINATAVTTRPRTARKLTYAAAVILFSGAQLVAAQSTGTPRLQGQVPLADQLNDRAPLGYQKNVKLVGHNDINHRLQNGNLGWVDDCAYVAGFAPGDNAAFGTAVLAVWPPRNPRLVQILPHF